MGVDQVLGGAWIHAQEVAVFRLALHLLSVVLAGGQFEHDRFSEAGDELQALMSRDMFITHSAVALNAITTCHACRP